MQTLPNEIWYHIVRYLDIEQRKSDLAHREQFSDHVCAQLQYLAWKLDLLSVSVTQIAQKLQRSVMCIDRSLFCPPYYKRMALGLRAVSEDMHHVNTEYQESVQKMKTLAQMMTLTPPNDDDEEQLFDL